MVRRYTHFDFEARICAAWVICFKEKYFRNVSYLIQKKTFLPFIVLILAVFLVGCTSTIGDYPAPSLGVVVDANFVVVDMRKGSASELAGVKVGDVLLTLNGSVYTTPDEWIDQIGAIEEGQTYQITVQRGNDIFTLTVTSARPPTPDYIPEITPTPIPSGLYYL